MEELPRGAPSAVAGIARCLVDPVGKFVEIGTAVAELTGTSMARKPNYQFERRERERAKAAKKADRLKAKAEKAEERKALKSGEAPADAESDPTPSED